MIQKVLFRMIILCCGWVQLQAQTNHGLKISTRGLPLIKKYSLEDHPDLFHNWEIIQDKRGIMFIATDHGIIEFDGSNWRIHPLPEQTSARSLAIAGNGQIFVAGHGELGYLKTNAAGQLNYISLLNKVKKFKFTLPVFSKVFATTQEVIFFSPSAVYIYHLATQKFDLIKATHRFHRMFQAGGQVYIQEKSKGLWKLEQNKLKFIPKSEIFAHEKIYTLLVHEQQQLLIGTHKNGFYLYNKQAFVPWRTEVDSLLKTARLYNGLKLSNDYLAFGTLNQGLLILDKQGKLLKHINKSTGLPSNIVFSLCLDQQNHLWLGLEQGVAYIDVFSPFTVFNQQLGLEGVVYTALKKGKDIFLGTSQGIFYKKIHTNEGFKKIPGTEGQTWHLTSLADGQLIAGHSQGILQINNHQATLNVHNGHISRVSSLVNQPDVILGCAEDGLYKLTNLRQPGKIKFQKIKGPEIGFSEYSYLYQGDHGVIWTSNDTGEVVKIQLNSQSDSITSVKVYNKAQGLPTAANNRVFTIDKKLVIATKSGLWRYDQANDVFKPHQLSQWIEPQEQVLWISEDIQGSIWLLLPDKALILQKIPEQEGYRKKELVFGLYRNKQVPFIYFIDQQQVILGTNQGIVCYEITYTAKKDTTFSALIRQVDWERTMGSDSLLFGGGTSTEQKAAFPHFVNDFRFTVASNHFSIQQPSQYQYFLEGYDKEWTTWTEVQKKEYTNLSAGQYALKVRAKNNNGEISKIAIYSFEIRAAWYNSWWVYVFLVLISILIVVVTIWWNARRLTTKNERLETLVKERTEELTRERDKIQVSFKQLEEQRGDLIYQNVQLEKQQEEIKAQAESLQETLEELQTEKLQKEDVLRLVEARNHYYTSGIRYAQTIQKAILPDESVMRQVLKDYFILYSPKDIVSGDFYWFSHISENVYEQITGESGKSLILVAAIDCTGHGVPGAFMSMIGNTLLNEIVNQRHFFEPVRILEMLNTKIRLSLRQEETYNADGMDVCFCRLESLNDGRQTLVSFTGARRPLYYKANQQRGLTELKGDRKIIGGWQRKKRVFTKQTVLLTEGGAIYLTTDGLVGLADPQGEKFSSLKMKNFFNEHAHLPMKEQKEKLLATIQNHQQDVEQRDDMTIMGIRV